jgi:hypothetical protein
MWAFCAALSSVLAVLAMRVGRTRPRHRVVAAFITINLIADLLRQAIKVNVLNPASEARPGLPFVGWPRVAFHVNELLLLAWPAGLAVVGALVLLTPKVGRRSARGVLACYLASGGALVAAYPLARGPVLARAFLGLELATLAVVGAAGVAWWRRPETEPPTLTELSVVAFAVIEGGVVSGWRGVLVGWNFQQGLYFVLYAALAALHVGELWAGKRVSTSA